MAGVIYQEGSDSDFSIPLGKDCIFSDDSKLYRVANRVDLLWDNRKYYELRAVDPNNSIQQFQLNISDESKLSIVDCPQVIEAMWPNVVYNGDYGATLTYINENIFKRCDVNHRTVTMTATDDVFTLDFDGNIHTVNKT